MVTKRVDKFEDGHLELLPSQKSFWAHPFTCPKLTFHATSPNILEFGDELSISIKTSLKTLETTASPLCLSTVIFLDCTVHNNLHQVNINNFGCYII